MALLIAHMMILPGAEFYAAAAAGWPPGAAGFR
jgi:hypothetical protein